MIIIVAILIYCLLIVIKRIYQPRVVKRLHEFDLEVNTWFIIIALAFVAYMIFVKGLTFPKLRCFNVCTSKRLFIWNYMCSIINRIYVFCIKIKVVFLNTTFSI